MPQPRGVLYPARLPTFDRLPAPEPVASLVRWFWIPEWRIQPGRTSRQQVIAFPACNLVVEPGGVGLAGPTTRTSFRDLTGSGWAVGALLRPAAVPHFAADPAGLRDAYRQVDLAVLHTAVREVMSGPGDGPDRRRRAVEVFSAWLAAEVPPPDHEGLLANTMAEVIDSDPAIRTVADAAARLAVSARSLQRLAHRYVGLTPSMMIRRRRLQEAAERLRTEPETTLAVVAADLGYSDHAHLANEFRSVLGLTLSGYREQVT
ncbi:AraC-like DNA-binding protein [Actinoplanes octamycinicus]|uniref:AraC-like DNA-binding protein n=1 Tax=Actinoplanes octamycinicus TaxID=135948 RepID=A0A7W7GY27_9ACTN|nr:helix-turn-helix domain-containing protein [Actinoplanes octamycinicus]MBB4740337.1 AraC-like DNA-binding protein [Actinoplanes octamycinicus]GIE62588.1 AraC family transcriptional regulator [Actinoplanes octamycinicus]